MSSPLLEGGLLRVIHPLVAHFSGGGEVASLLRLLEEPAVYDLYAEARATEGVVVGFCRPGEPVAVQ
eukprot:CAMPEP_0183370702 /NCGR_PEP_ID=MMETSP0164_2-20130417/103224_1 /TAXON_ID=221442 /ORGANISM="Coccolithus pelagicus ssp braarudi, Strain PLY182g" /LENGTH=66 /DNA_ID=CAMNT_0025547151 /DNA_START=75 /DNA_END=272 /DNA_ORIENTATION=-